MYKKGLYVALTVLFACGTLAEATSDLIPDVKSQVGNAEMRIQGHLDDCTARVLTLAKGNLNVIHQFDEFAETLLTDKELTEGEIHKIIDAIVFSAEKHQFQTRKDSLKTPYIIHPIGVACQLIQIGNVHDKDILIAALLHDTVEDTDTSFEEIREMFGPQVESLVREVTDDKSLPGPERKRLQIENASHKSIGAAQIKLSDKLYNLFDLANNPPPDWAKERIDAYFVWASQVVNNLPLVNPALKRAVDAVISDYWSISKNEAA